MLNYEEDIAGSFHSVPEEQQEIIMEIVANFHIRNGVKNADGSLGEVKITNKQMNDCLAWALVHNTI